MINILIDTRIPITDIVVKYAKEMDTQIDIDSKDTTLIKYDLIISDDVKILEDTYARNKLGILIYVVDNQEQVFHLQHINIRYYLRKDNIDMDLKKMFIDLRQEINEKIECIRFKDSLLEYTIRMKTILYIESYRNNLVIHTNTISYTLRDTLYHMQNKLNHSFVRCYKSYIVNMEEIVSIKKEEIHLKNSSILPIGNAYKEDVYREYQNFIDLKK